jgi:predicted nuclease of predicted toxin-antitoxin system
MNVPGLELPRWLQNQGYKVFSIYHETPGLSDDEVIEKAFIEKCILITNDKDFGEKVFREKKPHCGIIFFRLEDERAISKIETIRRLLDKYKNQLENNFITVTETKVRFARITQVT